MNVVRMLWLFVSDLACLIISRNLNCMMSSSRRFFSLGRCPFRNWASWRLFFCLSKSCIYCGISETSWVSILLVDCPWWDWELWMVSVLGFNNHLSWFVAVSWACTAKWCGNTANISMGADSSFLHVVDHQQFIWVRVSRCYQQLSPLTSTSLQRGTLLRPSLEFSFSILHEYLANQSKLSNPTHGLTSRNHWCLLPDFLGR